MSLRTLAKKFIAYTIEDEYKIYRLKHTPVKFRRYFTKEYHAAYDNVPVQENKIVFENYMGGGYGCNCKYVLQQLLMMPQDFVDTLDLVWIVQNAAKQKDRFPAQVRLVEYDSQEAFAELATAKLWVRNFHMVRYLNRGLLKKPEQVYIQMWHGSFGIKKIEGSCGYLNMDRAWLALAKKNAAMTDYWISNGSFESRVYRDAFWGAGKILEYGHPRNDIFFEEKSREICREKLRQRYQIGDERIVLYMPTFRDSGKSIPAGFSDGRLCEMLAERFGGSWKCALRLHPRLSGTARTQPASMDMAGTENGLADYMKESGGSEVFFVTDYPDAQELLAAADVVITDYSSAIFDFLLTGRPGFILAEDYDAYQNMRGLYYPLEDTPFPVAGTQAALYENILKFDEDAYRMHVQDFLNGKGSVEDGQAAMRVVRLILDCLEGEK